MIGNQFIKWHETIPEDCEQAMPIPFDNALTLFFEHTRFRCTIVDIDGTAIDNAPSIDISSLNSNIPLDIFDQYVKSGSCFRFYIYTKSGHLEQYYSNALVRTSATYQSVPYWESLCGTAGGSGLMAVNGSLRKGIESDGSGYFTLRAGGGTITSVYAVQINGEAYEFEITSGLGSSSVYLKVYMYDDTAFVGDEIIVSCFRSSGGGVDLVQYTPEGSQWLGDSTDGLSLVKYRCNEDAFGIPFSAGGYVQIWLQINLKNPQLQQEDKTYVKRDGDVVVLMAKYYKEWEAESEYIAEDMHDSLVAALSCDYVYINGVRMTKSDSYKIDWDNTIKKACGQKLAKATWKMRANVTERNSNC